MNTLTVNECAGRPEALFFLRDNGMLFTYDILVVRTHMEYTHECMKDEQICI